jgi:hypothetical protein
MATYVTVQTGDCITSLADAHGHFWETLWDAPENAALKASRVDPNCLLSGDKVFIPDLREKQVAVDTNATHRFRRKGIPAKLVLRIAYADGRPRQNARYKLIIDGAETSGVTGDDGFIRETLPPKAKQGTLRLPADPADEDSEDEEYELTLGTLSPQTHLSGIQARLNNLGVGDIELDGTNGPKTQAALRAFQLSHDLPVTGEPDAATEAKLRELHGS